MAIYLGETSFPQGNGSHFRLRMYIDNYSQSIENNTTWVRFHLYFVSLDGYSGSGSASNGYINGNHTGSTTSIGKNATVDMGYWDTTIYHNNDGTGGINWNGRITSPWGIGTAELSGYWTAPTIPRTTKIATQNGVVGSSVNITWSKASANFRHTLTYEFGNKTGTIGTNLVDGVDWNIPDSFYEEMEDSSSKQGNLTLTTYNGSTNIGSSTAILNVSVNESVVAPVITSKSVKDINTNTLELTGDNGTLISANSIPFAQIEFTTNKYATLGKITINGVDYTSDVVILSESDTNTNYMLEKELPVADKSDFEINVIDSRSLPINDIIKLDFINYIALDCIPVFKRIQPTTGEVGLEFDGKYFNDDFGAVDNNLKISYAYKIKEEDTYSNEILLNENTDYKIVNNTFHSGSGTYKSQINLGAIFDYKKVYNFILYVEDQLTKLVINVLVVKGIPIFWWNGEKVTINGDLYIADEDGNNPINVKDLGGGADYDSLPVGSIINFDGDEVPVGYEIVQNNAKILWTNSDPNVTIFNAQDISLNSSDYDYFDVLYYCYKDVRRIQSARVYKNYPIGNLTTVFEYNGTMYAGCRYMTKKSDTLYSISSCNCSGFGKASVDVTPDWILPMMIIGGTYNS